jgi:hypothetical protein
MKNRRKISRYPILGRDFNSVETSLFMLGTAFILLNGLKSRIFLILLRFGTDGIREIRPTHTVRKSRIFHGSLK